MLNRFKKIIILILIINTINIVNGQEKLLILEKEYKSKTYFDKDYYDVVAQYVQILFVNYKEEESFNLLEQEYKTAKKINDVGNYAYLKSIEAIQYYLVGDKEKSSLSFKEAKINAEKTKDYNIKGYVAYAGGWLSIRNDDRIGAVTYFLEAIKHHELAEYSKKTIRRKSVIYSELGRIYGDWDDHELQEKYTFKALEYALKQDDHDAIFSAHMAVGQMYEDRLSENPNDEKLRDLIEYYYTKSIEIYNKNQMVYTSDLSFASINLARLYIKYFPDSYIDRAQKYATVSRNIAIKNQEPNQVASVLEILAEIAIKKKNKTEAKKLFLEALEEIEKSQKKDYNIELSIIENLMNLESEEGNFKKALEYQQKYISLFRYIYDSKKLAESKRLESEHKKELQKKELEKLQLLSDKKEQQIQLLKFQKLEKEAQFNNLKLIEENQAKKLKLSELVTQKKQQELKLAKLETQSKNKDLANYQEKLNYREQIGKFYVISIAAIILILLLVLFLLRQRTIRMREKDKTYEMAIEKEKQLTKISALTSLLDGQERERERLARDLHDGLGGLLSATKLKLSDFLEKNNCNNQNEELKNISNHIDFAIDKLRKVSHNLLPDLIIKYGLKVALEEFANRMKNKNLEIHVNFLGYSNKLDTDKQLFVYRIIQELVNNAIKHSEARNIIIQLVEEAKLYQITVEDDGKGFEINNLEFKNSAGFINIQSRIEFLKGNFEIHSQKDLGTSFEFNFPK